MLYMNYMLLCMPFNIGILIIFIGAKNVVPSNSTLPVLMNAKIIKHMHDYRSLVFSVDDYN